MTTVNQDYVLDWDELSESEECDCEGVCCTTLLNCPAGVLKDKSRWPEWLCTRSFYFESTRRWWRRATFFDDPNRGLFVGERDVVLDALQTMAYTWPLPIGTQAVEHNWRHIVRGADYVTLLSYAPFDGDEEAIWALRVQDGPNTLDLFGLADYKSADDGHLRREHVNLGAMRHVLRGKDTSLLGYLHHAERWWSSWRGRGPRPLGRPPDTGTWQSRNQCREAIATAIVDLRSEGAKETQENVASRLNCNDRVLRYWLSRYGLEWKELLRTS